MSKYKSSYAKLAVNRKNKYASDCGAGKEGSGGFQPGNTCGGTGKGGDAKTKPEGMPRRKPNTPKNAEHNEARGLVENPNLVGHAEGLGTVEEARERLKGHPYKYTDEQLDWLQYGQHGEDTPSQAGEKRDVGEGSWQTFGEMPEEFEGDGVKQQKYEEMATDAWAMPWEDDMGYEDEYQPGEPKQGLDNFEAWMEENHPEMYDELSPSDMSKAYKNSMKENPQADTGAGEGYDETPGADAPSKEDIEAMEGLDIMQPDTGAGESMEEASESYRTGTMEEASGLVVAPYVQEDGTINEEDMETMIEELKDHEYGFDEQQIEEMILTTAPGMFKGGEEGEYITKADIEEQETAIAKERQTGAGEGGGLEEQDRNLAEALGMSGSTEEEAREIIDSASASQDVIPQWGSSSDMRVWIGSEGAYSQGELVGEWVDATDVVEATEALTKKWQEQGYGDEWAVMDSEGVPDSLHHDMEGIADYANTLQSHDNPEALQAYADTAGIDFEDAVAQFEDAYAGEAGQMSKRGQYDLPMGFVYDYIESTGGETEFLANQANPHNYIDREKLVRDLSIDNRYDIQEDDEGSRVVDEDGEVVYHGSDFNDAEGWIEQSDEDLADELIESGLSNPENYFDYEQLAYDLVIGGDIMVSTDNNHVFWNM